MTESPAAVSDKFHLYTPLEMLAWPHQPALIPACLEGGNLAAVTGDPAFFSALCEALGRRAVSLVTRRGDQLMASLEWMEPYRGRGPEPLPARLVYVEPRDPLWNDYWVHDADLVLEAKTAALARVVKVRDFANTRAPLLIENGVARLAGKVTAERK